MNAMYYQEIRNIGVSPHQILNEKNPEYRISETLYRENTNLEYLRSYSLSVKSNWRLTYTDCFESALKSTEANKLIENTDAVLQAKRTVTSTEHYEVQKDEVREKKG